jgi:probable addiction module antidote protein
MTIELEKYDAAEFLSNENEMELYLKEIMSTGDQALILSALGDIARAKNISDLSKRTGISREGIYKALSGSGNPTFHSILKITKALGLTLSIQSL